METDLDIGKIHLMARGIILQLNEHIEYLFDLELLNHCHDALEWLEIQAQPLEGYEGLEQQLRGWIHSVERQIDQANTAKNLK